LDWWRSSPKVSCRLPVVPITTWPLRSILEANTTVKRLTSSLSEWCSSWS
jgi:hypothetical protein